MNLEVYCAYSEMWDIDKVVENPKNPNHHPEKQIALLAKIIKGHGWRAPITVSKRSGFVVRGHGRLAAAKRLNLSQVPVDLQDYASEAEEYADMIADNRIAELAEIDQDELNHLVAELSDMEYDTGLLGFTDKQIQEMLSLETAGGVDEDDFDLEESLTASVNPNSKLGDIYRLGKHILMCGNSLCEEDVEKLVNGTVIDMIWTDPPYNVDYEGRTKKKLKISNDKMSEDEFYDFLACAFQNMHKVTKPGGAIYVCFADRSSNEFRMAMTSAGWLLKQGLIWLKNVFVMGRQDYQWQHEPILYGWKDGGSHNFFGGRKQSTILIDNFPISIADDVDGSKLITINYGVQSATLKVPSYEVIDHEKVASVGHIDRPAANRDHPTAKPIKLVARAICNSSREGESVLDLFGGSGSTLIACEKTNRRCFTMELDPVYCDVIIKRWEKLTHNVAVKIN